LQPIFDALWRAEAVAGGQAAVRRLAEAAIGPLYRFCLYRVGRNHHLCEEVVQESLLGAIRRLDRYDPSRTGGDIFPWLTGLARNEIRRVLARERLSADLEAFWRNLDAQLLSLYAMLDREPFDEDLLVRAETREMVNATMAQLPGHYGRVLEAKYVRGQSVVEIASAMGTSPKAAESVLSRARAAFRETFLALARGLSAEAAG
jgi:RNA polymerase sigma-70 factor, ECF subfamily